MTKNQYDYVFDSPILFCQVEISVNNIILCTKTFIYIILIRHTEYRSGNEIVTVTLTFRCAKL